MADPLRFPLSGPPCAAGGRHLAPGPRRGLGAAPADRHAAWKSAPRRPRDQARARARRSRCRSPAHGAGDTRRRRHAVLVLGLGYLAARGAVWVRRRLLWRVRRKLILSYVFVGLVPSLLIVAFFLLAGLLLFRNMASYLVQTRINAQAEQARFLAQTVLLDVQRAPSAEAVRDTLERQQASGSTRYPFLSIALVPARELACPQAVAPVASGRMPPVALPTTAGPWAHLAAPLSLPSWMTCDGLARVIAYDAAGGRPGEDTDVRLVARAVAVPPVRSPTWAVVLDLPISAGVEERMAIETGIRLGAIDRVPIADSPALAPGSRTDVRTDSATSAGLTDQLLRRWVVLLEHLDWATGASGTVSVQLSLGLVEMYRRLTAETALGGAIEQRAAGDAGGGGGAVPADPGRGAAHRPGAGPADHRRGARPVHRHAAPAQPRLHPCDPGASPRSARRTGRLVQRHDRRGDPAAHRRRPEGAPRAGVRHRPRDPDEAAAAGAADRAGAGRVGLLRAGPRGWRRLLRCLPGGRAAVRLPHRRRLGQGRRRRPLHGAAEGPGPVAGAPEPVAARPADCGQPGDRRSPRRPQLHHHELPGRGLAQAGDDLRPSRPLPAAAGTGAPRQPAAAGEDAGPGWPGGRAQARRRYDVRLAARGGDRAAGGRRPGGAVHRRHQRDDEPGGGLLRRRAARRSGRRVSRPAARSAGRDADPRGAFLRRRGRPARRHDHVAAQGGGADRAEAVEAS